MSHKSLFTAARSAAGLLVALVCSLAAPAWASVHPVEGDDVGEPAPSDASVHVVREELSIDLSGVDAPRGLVRFRARYWLRNDGPAQTMDLTLPLSHAETARVSLDGQVVPRAASAGTSTKQATNGKRGRTFVLHVAPGEHRLDLYHQAKPGVVPLGDVYGFGVDFDLAGAQGWASLGPLALTLRVPQGWKVVEHPTGLPAFGHNGSEYRAQFKHFPRGDILHAGRDGTAASLEHPDMFRLHIEPPLMPHRAFWVVQILAWLIALALPWLAIKRLRRHSRLSAGRLSGGQIVASALVCTALVVALPLGALALHIASYRYLGDVRLMFLLIAVAWIIGSVSCWTGHTLLYRRVATAR